VSDALTPEQEARNLLERMWVDDAQDWSAGDVVELANILARLAEAERQLGDIRAACDHTETGWVGAPGLLLILNRAAMGESRGDV
jgi:hypothetical protein